MRRGTTLTETIIAAAIAMLVMSLLMTFLVGSRRHEARTARRLDELTEATRATRALALDLQEAFVGGKHAPRATPAGLELWVCRGLALHPGAQPELVAVTYAFDAATGTVTRRAGDRSAVLARVTGAVSFEVSPSSDGFMIRARVGRLGAERLVLAASAAAGALPWSGPGVATKD